MVVFNATLDPPQDQPFVHPALTGENVYNLRLQYLQLGRPEHDERARDQIHRGVAVGADCYAQHLRGYDRVPVLGRVDRVPPGHRQGAPGLRVEQGEQEVEDADQHHHHPERDAHDPALPVGRREERALLLRVVVEDVARQDLLQLQEAAAVRHEVEELEEVARLRHEVVHGFGDEGEVCQVRGHFYHHGHEDEEGKEPADGGTEAAVFVGGVGVEAGRSEEVFVGNYGFGGVGSLEVCELLLALKRMSCTCFGHFEDTEARIRLTQI